MSRGQWSGEGGRALLSSAPLFLFLGLCFFLYARVWSGAPAVPSTPIVRSVPEFVLPSLEGLVDASNRPVPSFSSIDLKKGDVVWVNIWASWCGACRQEHAALRALADEGETIYGLNYRDSPSNALSFLTRFGNPFEKVGVDRKGRFAVDWGIYGVPETFLVRGDGVILHRHAGPLDLEAIRRVRARFLKEGENR